MHRRLIWPLAVFPVVALGYAVSSLATGCDGGGGADASDDGAVPTPSAWDTPVTRPDDQTATQNRASCTYKRGDMPAATLGASTPVDKDIPITNVIVITLENHSFDNYFGRLGAFLNRTDIESPPPNASNPGPPYDGGALDDAGNGIYPYTHADHLCTLDTNHEWNGSLLEWADGGMTGFVQQNDGWSAGDLPQGADPSLASGARAMFYYDQTDIPFYYALAQNFAIADHYHASLRGPTWPNRMYQWSATSFGITINTFPPVSQYGFPPTGSDGGYAPDEVSILDELEERHTDWMIYADALPTMAVVHGIGYLNRWGRPVIQKTADFMAAAKAGTLPSMAFVDPDTTHENADGQDEHPPADIQIGQKFVSDIVHAVMASPQWPHAAIFITWDEHGGFYDHVPPPSACIPDNLDPVLGGPDNTIPAKFDHLGMRVPFIVVSPYAKKGYVGHVVYDHTSVLRFIEAKFKVPALSGRDANADIPTDLFDFSAPAQLTPPTIPEPTIDPAGVTYCETTFPHDGGLGL
jgi:phospholipase C